MTHTIPAGRCEDVGALVDRITEDEVGVTLLNLNPNTAKTVIVQDGAYAEHQITGVVLEGEESDVDHSRFMVRIATDGFLPAQE